LPSSAERPGRRASRIGSWIRVIILSIEAGSARTRLRSGVQRFLTLDHYIWC
jgi:hypothetical protein